MAFTDAAKPAPAATGNRLQKIVGTGKHDAQSSKPSLPQSQDLPLYAELTGDNFASLGEIVVRGRTPVLSLCRELLAQGVDPDQALEVYRRGVLALKVRSIGEGAKLTVEESSDGRPRFRKFRPWGSEGSPPSAKNDPALSEWQDWPAQSCEAAT
jgi:hypothetical protein